MILTELPRFLASRPGPDGRNLFYRNGNAVMAVPVKSGTDFEHGTPIILFQGSYINSDTVVGSLWDISPDGNRFLMLKNIMSESGGPYGINIVLNWFEELKERVPIP